MLPESQKEFLQELKLQYEDMPSAKEAELTIRDFDRVNSEDISGIIAKAKSVSFDKTNNTCRIACEVKLFSLDVKNIENQIEQLNLKLNEANDALNGKKEKADSASKEIDQLNSDIQKAQIALEDIEAIYKKSLANINRI